MLTDAQIRKTKPADKAFRLVDSGGLHLFVTPAGGKFWRLRYRFEGKENTLSLGQYPAMTLVEARDARERAKRVLKQGKDPSVQKKLDRLDVSLANANTFELMAREWFNLQRNTWTERHAADVIDSLERDVFPDLGSVPVVDIRPPAVLAVLRKVERRGATETARRLRQRISAVFVYAISSGRAEDDPAAVVTRALAPLRKGRQPAIVDLEAAREMMRRTEAVPAHPVTKLAIRLLALTVVRPGTLAQTPWTEFGEMDAEQPVWQVPADRLKLLLKHKDDEARDHIVPLSRQALETIAVLRSITGKGPYVFPNSRHAHKPMSENAMGYLLNRAGYHHKHVPHGFRSSFSTIMNELYPADRATIDFMLGHVPKDAVEKAYNRALYLPRRIELAQLWADLILKDAPPAADLSTGPRRINRR